MVLNFANPCQEFVFEGDVIKCVQTFKYLGIWETTLNLNSAVEHLITASKRSLFALNRYYAQLRIMDVKLHCDLFNTLVRSTASYACEVWVDSKKIEAIEIVYRRFLKFLLGCKKQRPRPSCRQNLANSSLNTLHGHKRCCTITV